MTSSNSPNFEFEHAARKRGYVFVAGVDEAGRGPLAGEVVAAAVILPWDMEESSELNDSKKLTAKKREALFTQLLADERVRTGIGIATVEEIDKMNILNATHLAMRLES